MRALSASMLTLAASAALFAPATAWAEPPTAEFAPSSRIDLPALQVVVVQHSPSLQQDLLTTDLARAEARQAHLLGNPTLDATWGTIPIGETNPPGMSKPLANVPNYTVGLSYTFLLGKRGPRQERAEALVVGAQAAAQASARGQALALARILGTLATAELRLDALRNQVLEQRETIQLAKSRLEAGYGTPLDVDRLEIEMNRVEQQVVASEGEVVAQLATCSEYVRVRCVPFPSIDDARAFLGRWVDAAIASSAGAIEQRPDVRALEAYGRAAVAEKDLANAQAIPDPTVRLAYTRDQFTAAGNQENSLTLGVTLPLTIFDHGQAQRQAAEARLDRFSKQRSALVGTSKLRAQSLREAVTIQQRRKAQMAELILPRARAVLGDLQKAANNRLIPLTDVIQARRTVNELLIQEVDSYADAFEAAVDLMGETST